MAAEDENATYVPLPVRPCCSSSRGSKRHNFNSDELARLFKLFNDLDEIVKPIDRNKYVQQHREYYIEKQHERLRMTEEIGNVQKWTKGSKEYIVVLPNRVWVRDNNPNNEDPEPEMEPPLPFDIKDHLDRKVALGRIRELFKEMDEILYRKNPEPEAEPVTPSPPQNRANDDESRYDSYENDNDLLDMSDLLNRTRML